MAYSGSGDQSVSLSSTIGRTTTRFSVESPNGDVLMALPSLVMTGTGEGIPLTDGGVVECSEEVASSLTIVDAAMKSRSSSLTASHAHGATGSSESRGKSRSPRRAWDYQYTTLSWHKTQRDKSCGHTS